MTDLAVPTESMPLATKPFGLRSLARSMFQSRWGTYALGIAVAAAIAVFVLIWAAARTASLSAGIALLRGDSIHAFAEGPIVLDSNSASPTGSTMLMFHNLSGEHVRIVGYDNPCSCFSISNLPIEIFPNERKSVPVHVSGAKLNGRNDVTIVFLTDCENQRRIPLQLSIQQTTADAGGKLGD
jgi:hypothetical protein